MTEIFTIYRGYKITYSDNAESWICYDLTESHGKTFDKLSLAKSAIDKLVKSLRDKASVQAFEMYTGDGGVTLTPALVTEYLGFGKERYEKTEYHRVASAASRSKGRVSRKEIALGALIPDTPEMRAAAKKVIELGNQIKALRDERDAAIEAIPRLQLDDIKDLVDIYNSQQAPEEKTE